jgi:hypothetical protein
MRILISLLLAITCFNAAAQMQQDSSVVIMAHWTKRDVVEYKLTESSYTVVGTDTTNCKTAISKLAFKVQKRAKDSYEICLKINAGDQKDMKKTKILFTTDIYGRIMDITNLEKISAARKKMGDMSAARDYISKYLNIFSFHGTRMKLGEDYNGETEVNSPVPEINKSLKACTKVYIDTDYTDDKFAVARMAVYTEEGMEISYQQYMSIQVNLETGWPIVSFFDKFIETEDSQGICSTNVQSECIELVL